MEPEAGRQPQRSDSRTRALQGLCSFQENILQIQHEAPGRRKHCSNKRLQKQRGQSWPLEPAAAADGSEDCKKGRGVTSAF